VIAGTPVEKAIVHVAMHGSVGEIGKFDPSTKRHLLAQEACLKFDVPLHEIPHVSKIGHAIILFRKQSPELKRSPKALAKTCAGIMGCEGHETAVMLLALEIDREDRTPSAK
jgi:hypothetical protein